MTLKTFSEFQEQILAVYGERDGSRGVEGIVLRLVEELGELVRSVRREDRARQREELGDLLTWIASLASAIDVTLQESVQRYREGCPYCGQTPCVCPNPRVRAAADRSRTSLRASTGRSPT